MKKMSLQGEYTQACVPSKNTRNGKIEFLRFIFATIIVIHHSRAFLGDEISPFLGGSLGVEFFFFVSGYLMMVVIAKRNRIAPLEAIGKETAKYILKKWSSVLVEAFISFAIAFIVMIIAKRPAIYEIILTLIDSIWELLFITMTGLGKRGINSVVWYISAMLLCMAILYPLLRKYPDVMLHIIIPVSSLCIFGYLYQNGGSVRNPTKWLGWTYRGVLRAFAEIGIGCLLYYFTQYICSFSLTKVGRWFVTITENACYLLVLYYMFIAGAKKYDYFFVALIAVAIAFTFSEQGVDTDYFNNKFVLWLGRFSIPLYFSHTFFASYLNYFVPTEWSIKMRLLIYMCISFVTALFVMALSSAIREKLHNIGVKIKRLLIQT